jgi:Fe-S-cluster-containing hydrogenase component 2
MPCKIICPVDAISKGPLSTITEGAKIGPIVSFSECIGCTRCHKICGYNSIEWVNVPYKSTSGAGGGN